MESKNKKLIYAGIIIGAGVISFGIYKLIKSLKTKKLFKTIGFKAERGTFKAGGYSDGETIQSINVSTSKGYNQSFPFGRTRNDYFAPTGLDTKYNFQYTSIDNNTTNLTVFADGSKIWSKTFTK